MSDAQQTFEGSLAKLEKLVSEMESGELPLDAMMTRFEEGRGLVAKCTAELESIRQRIEKVVSAPNEPPKVQPLEVL